MTAKAKASADNTAKKQRGIPFPTGQSGNPSGRPQGSRNKATLALQSLLDGQAEALTLKAVEMALAGDMQALRLCMERIVPPRKDAPITFDMPPLKTAEDAVTASAAIAQALAAGELTPSEASTLSNMVQAFTESIKTADLEARIKAIEEGMPK